MDSAGDARRRKALLMKHANGSTVDTLHLKSNPRRQSRKATNGSRDLSGRKHPTNSSDDGETSDFSSRTASDDVELKSISSDLDFSEDEEAGLAKKDLGRRKRRRRRNTLLKDRVIGVPSVSKQEHDSADRSVVRALLINALLIASWYAFSLSISIYNKWMFSEKFLDFKFPLFTTCVHMLVQFTLACVVLYFVPRLRPKADSTSSPHNHGHARRDPDQPEKPLMTRMFYLTRIGPCGAATGLDIGLGNMSLRFITLTFFTMCKSSALAFVLIFAFLFRLETPSIKLVMIIVTMTIGVIMMVAGETAFNALGFVLVISASFFSGFRWSLTQILLLRNPATSNPFSGIFFLAPAMFLALLIMAVPTEGFGPLAKGLGRLVKEKGVVEGIGILLFPGVLAFLMTASEFALLQRTSVVTLSICGIFKEVVTISAAAIVFHDPLTPINISGLIVTIGSIAAYNYIKITKMREIAKIEAEKAKAGEGEAAEPMLADQDDDTGVHDALPDTLRDDSRPPVLHKEARQQD
ncbi:MAG: hypothetical protein Q9195_000016 [Heterodermia aff. obscurata]